jgi:hypothetical protein
MRRQTAVFYFVSNDRFWPRGGGVPPVEVRVPSHAVVLELQGTEGTNRFHRQLFLARLVGLIFIQAME